MSAILIFEQESDEGESDRAPRTRQHVRREMRVVSVCCLVFRRRSCRRQQGQEAQHQARCQTLLVVQGIEVLVERGSSIEDLFEELKKDEVGRSSRRDVARWVFGVAGDNKLRDNRMESERE